MATTCPYCKKEIEGEIYQEWVGDYWTHIDDFECPKCGNEIIIEVDAVPEFSTRKKT